jgi:PPOX class probable F420-dependent enzyme
MDAEVTAFLEQNHQAAMTALRPDGTPHVVRIGIALVDGKIWSSATNDRARTKMLRRDPRSTLFVFDAHWAYLTLECRVSIIEGPEVPDASIRLFDTMQSGMTEPGKLNWYGQPKTYDEFRQIMVDEKRIIFEFEPLRHYGLFGSSLPR